MLTPAHREFYGKNGYVVVERLFDPEEVSYYRQHFMELRKGQHEGDFSGVAATDDDPLKKYPRMIHMHRWDEASLKAYILDPQGKNPGNRMPFGGLPAAEIDDVIAYMATLK